ncbi:helix-turn-helix transcriptional regulator [Cellulomonas marina]|uniref:Proteasome accessory factor B n=1 Tax=Cellulomonas marina TaxID=988821 RepID=A0A1I0WBR3_9CELL|nr:WYL domain-containing protein [Cellulomonas marina]SFA85346.1 proteasome accessory factor B [Cellulomonas marina]
MADPTPAAERLLNLVIALVNTSRRMTKEQVRRSVAGYADAASDEAFERMFERDKDTLRELGVPLVTVTGQAHGDDVGYRVDTDAWSLPPVELTSAELGVLGLAAGLWQDRALRADTDRALTKLRAVGEGPGSADLLQGLAPRVRAGGAALAPLVDAVQERQAVQFAYRAASTGERRTRTVEPWQLLTRTGGWVLIGHDRDRGATRSFRLSRVEGGVRRVGEPGAFPPPSRAALDEALAAWGEGEERRARLAVLPERAAVLRARAVPEAAAGQVEGQVEGHVEGRVAGQGTGRPTAAPDGRDVVVVPYRSPWELAEEVVGQGDAVLVLDPPELRRAVLRLLGAAARLDELPASVPAGPATSTDASAGEDRG